MVMIGIGDDGVMMASMKIVLAMRESEEAVAADGGKLCVARPANELRRYTSSLQGVGGKRVWCGSSTVRHSPSSQEINECFKNPSYMLLNCGKVVTQPKYLMQKRNSCFRHANVTSRYVRQACKSCFLKDVKYRCKRNDVSFLPIYHFSGPTICSQDNASCCNFWARRDQQNVSSGS